MSLIEIKTVLPEDTADVASLAETIWLDYWPGIIGLDQTTYMITKYQSQPVIEQQLLDGYTYFLAHNQGDNQGYCAVLQEGQRLMISKLYVLESARGQGIGRVLMTTIKEDALRRRCNTLWLVVNKNNSLAIAVYEKLGFIRTDSTIQDIGNGFIMDDYVYELELET